MERGNNTGGVRHFVNELAIKVKIIVFAYFIHIVMPTGSVYLIIITVHRVYKSGDLVILYMEKLAFLSTFIPCAGLQVSYNQANSNNFSQIDQKE